MARLVWDRSAWDEDFSDVLLQQQRQDSEQDWADRWTTAWDLLERHGVVGPEDRNLPLHELERLAGYMTTRS